MSDLLTVEFYFFLFELFNVILNIFSNYFSNFGENCIKFLKFVNFFSIINLLLLLTSLNMMLPGAGEDSSVPSCGGSWKLLLRIIRKKRFVYKSIGFHKNVLYVF